FSKEVSLFQLNDHPKPKLMFNKNYPFFTGSSKGMINHFKEYSNWIKKNYLKKSKNLIEIGSNDGTFLSNFKGSKINTLGIEPSSNVARISKKKGIKTINSFFTYENVKKLKKFKNNTDIISAANVICHVPDLKNLIKGVDCLLNKNGLFIFEEPYLGSMYEKTSYDQIYDEHIFMFSVNSIKKIFKLFNFDLINVLPQKTHGGSMRYVVGRLGAHKIDNNVLKFLKQEKKKNIDSIKGCLNFKKKCEISKKKLKLTINNMRKNGKKIAGYAATSKSTTILNYCGITKNDIDFICDTTPNKINSFTPGTHIPIVTVDYFKENIPDCTFLFAWNHKKEIFKKEKNILNKTKWFAHLNL
ncbi:class I SAM-dependent methyltransferase, partial [Candidatus Pelagibacter sp.]|nr:class I SAM-dependent methyltransferase [Candidatus Pelagibacter sp.]